MSTEVGRRLAEMAKASPLHDGRYNLIRSPKDTLHEATLRLYKIAGELGDEDFLDHLRVIINATPRH